MTLKEKLKHRRFEKYWKEQGRKDLFTWVHRYLRLHSELLTDSVYKSIYDYFRNTLIVYLKDDIGNKKIDDTQFGNMVDFFADIFNEKGSKLVDKYKAVVDELYLQCKSNPNIIKEIRI